ncbi:MAG: hypothetical protein Q8K92_22685 [Leadbetterella sp.]|nr:hypothetical protein [Leadbetterella sp.]
MKTYTTLLNTFDFMATKYLLKNPSFEIKYERINNSIEMIIPKKSISGFDVGVTVQTYGMYPWAGAWHGAALEPMKEWLEEEVCSDFFGFLRTILSPDARLRYKLYRNNIKAAILEIREKNGNWKIHDKYSFFVIPFGDYKEVEHQNIHFTSRFPYDGLELTQWGFYRW